MASGRILELQQITRANRAAAVVRLMLGELRTWQEFGEADQVSPDLPRRSIKAGARDVRKNVSKRIKSWIDRNFVNADIKRLEELYEEILAKRGLVIPLRDFEQRFFHVRSKVLRGAPPHATVVISLWGLKFMFPEDFLTKDIITALSHAVEAEQDLLKYKKSAHEKVAKEEDRVSKLLRHKAHAQRSCLHACFGLLESYLNGLAWVAVEGTSEVTYSNHDKAYLENCGGKSLRCRLKNVPRILTGKHLWAENDELFTRILKGLKPFRDSLTHPSPFRVPEKFGGYDKLSLFYRVELETAILAAELIARAVGAIHQHVKGMAEPEPAWLTDLNRSIKDARTNIEEAK